MAIWTSGEPVSFSWVAFWPMTSVFFSLVIMVVFPFCIILSCDAATGGKATAAAA